jgi:hypothetical protein
VTTDELKWVVSIIVALGGVVTFLIRRHDTKKDPLPRQSAEMALAVSAAGVVQSSNLRLEAEVQAIGEALARERLRNDGNEIRNAELERRIDDLEEKGRRDSRLIEDQQTEIVGLKRRVEGMITDRDALVRFVDVLRVWFASGAKPPPPSIPAHLADVLPPWVPADGAEVPQEPTD